MEDEGEKQMTNLPDRFGSKREMDVWLASRIDGWGDVNEDAGMGYHPESHKWMSIPHYTTSRVRLIHHDRLNKEDALDLLWEFCRENNLELRIEEDGICIFCSCGRGDLRWQVSEGFEGNYKFDPFAISVAIYRAYNELEEKQR